MTAAPFVVAASVVVYGGALLLFLLLIRQLIRRGGLRGSVGPGASGAVYELLNEDRRAAVEVIVEERTGYRDPEDRDGSMDDLDSSAGPSGH